MHGGPTRSFVQSECGRRSAAARVSGLGTDPNRFKHWHRELWQNYHRFDGELSWLAGLKIRCGFRSFSTIAAKRERPIARH